jgi:hypothetical protein
VQPGGYLKFLNSIALKDDIQIDIDIKEPVDNAAKGSDDFD